MAADIRVWFGWEGGGQGLVGMLNIILEYGGVDARDGGSAADAHVPWLGARLPLCVLR